MATDADKLMDQVRSLIGKPTIEGGRPCVDASPPRRSQLLSETAPLSRIVVTEIFRRGNAAIEDTLAELAKDGRRSQESSTTVTHAGPRISELLAPEVFGGNDLHKAVVAMDTDLVHHLLYGTIEVRETADTHKMSNFDVTRANSRGHTPVEVARMGESLAKARQDPVAARRFGLMASRIDRYLTPKREDVHLAVSRGELIRVKG